MSLLDTITDLATGTYTVTQYRGGSFTSGIWTPGPPITTTIVACVQPATGLQRVVGGRDMRSMVDGEEVYDVRVLWTETLLVERLGDRDGDHVTIDGREFRVFRVERWDLAEVTYYHVVLTLIAQGGS